MTNSKLLLSAAAAAILTLSGCGSSGGGTTTPTTPDSNTTTPATSKVLTGTLSTMTLSASTVYELDGKVIVPSGVTLTIEPGTTIIGLEGTNAWLLVLPGGKLMAEGTVDKPITFTSEIVHNGGADAHSQWGGVSIVGNTNNAQTLGYEVDASLVPGTDNASSGSLKYVKINNTGIAIEQDKEINGLSLYGVSASTTVENISVKNSGDDGVEIWGGAVNLKTITIDGSQDDSFDTDDGWIGTVDNLIITNGVMAGIEMSGNTVATYKNVQITVPATSATSEGGLYFKAGSGENVGGKFDTVTVTYNSSKNGAITTAGKFDEATSTMKVVKLEGTNTAIKAKDSTKADDNTSAAEAKVMYNAQL